MSSGRTGLLLAIIIPHLAIVACECSFSRTAGQHAFHGPFPRGDPVSASDCRGAAYVLAVPLLYKVQAWSHKVYNVARDMTEFNTKYKKGFALFVLLSIYEMPLLLNYLVFDKNNWPTWLSRNPAKVRTARRRITSPP